MIFRKEPNQAELEKKIFQCKQSIMKKKCAFGPVQDAVFNDLTELNIGNTLELWPLLVILFDEIRSADYVDTTPLSKLGKFKINCDVYKFCWNSSKLKKGMSIQFAMIDDCFYYISLGANLQKKWGG